MRTEHICNTSQEDEDYAKEIMHALCFCEMSCQNLITVQQDATYSVYYISVGSSTCFGC